LQQKDEAPHEQEYTVVEETLKDVELVMDLPRTDHVHDLHKDKQVEEESEVSGVSTGEMQVFGTHAFDQSGDFLKVCGRHLVLGSFTNICEFIDSRLFVPFAE